jgi:hypothetical protein
LSGRKTMDISRINGSINDLHENGLLRLLVPVAAKERIDEMDAIVASLKGKASEMQTESRGKADKFIGDLRKMRDEFERTTKKQAEAGEAVLEATKAQLETQWKHFEAEAKKYFETFGKDVMQQKAVFESQVGAQMNAWREAANKMQAAAADFAAERRREDATVTRMKADAAASDERLQKLARAGTESWSALSAALAETRGVFDRANQAAREAFKRAAQ